MRVVIGRIAGALAALIVTWVVGALGLEVSADQHAGIVQWLSEGLTALGTFVALLVYALVHKAVDSRTNPGDVAKSGAAPAPRVLP